MKLTLLKSSTGILSVVSSTGCDSVRSIAWDAKWPSFWGTLGLELVTNWSIFITIFHIKKIGTVNAYDNRYIEIIVKLEQKNNGTYGCIAISKDIVILSIVMRRFYCTSTWSNHRNITETSQQSRIRSTALPPPPKSRFKHSKNDGRQERSGAKHLLMKFPIVDIKARIRLVLRNS